MFKQTIDFLKLVNFEQKFKKLILIITFCINIKRNFLKNELKIIKITIIFNLHLFLNIDSHNIKNN